MTETKQSKWEVIGMLNENRESTGGGEGEEEGYLPFKSWVMSYVKNLSKL